MRTSNGRPEGKRRIGVLVFDGVKMLDFVGPAEVFQEANQQVSGYEMLMISHDGADVTTSMGVRVGVDWASSAVPELDTLIIPGSEHAPAVYDSTGIRDAVRALSSRSRRTAAICSGAFALAAAGLLNGRAATTHWKFAPLLAAQYPDVTVKPDAIFVQDGCIFTSAGVAAGIDLALALLEDDHGADVTRTVAQLLLVYMKRSGGQSQFSASLRAASPSTPVARSVTDYINADPSRPATLSDLAGHAKVSTRHLTRVIREELGVSPIEYVTSMRLDLATGHLESGMTITESAARAGFASAGSFRRSFAEKLGITPSEYQRRFQTTQRENKF